MKKEPTVPPEEHWKSGQLRHLSWADNRPLAPYFPGSCLNACYDGQESKRNEPVHSNLEQTASMYCATYPCRIRLVCVSWEDREDLHEGAGAARRAARVAHDYVRARGCPFVRCRIRDRAENGYVSASRMDLGFVQLRVEGRDQSSRASLVTPFSVFRNGSCTLCTPFFVLFIVPPKFVPEYFRILDDLIQEVRVGLDGLVDLIQLLLIPKLFENVLVGARETVYIFPPPVVGRELSEDQRRQFP